MDSLIRVIERAAGWPKWTYEPQRDLIDTVENHFGPLAGSTVISRYDYAHDAGGWRSEVIRAGAAFVAGPRSTKLSSPSAAA